MVGAHQDKGARCYRHYGEVFMPRCVACEGLNREYSLLHIDERPNAS